MTRYVRLDELDRLLLSNREAMLVGDQRLEEHIRIQIDDVHRALTTADSLERERLSYIRELAESQNRTTAAAFDSHLTESSDHFARIDNEMIMKITKEEYDRRHMQLEDRVRAMEDWRANFTGRFAVGAVLGTVVISTATAFITHLVG